MGRHLGLSTNGRLTIRDSTLVGNSTGAGGGAIYDVGTSMTVQGSTFNGNQSADRGGAIGMDLPNPASTIENSTFTGNHTTGGRGGAIYSYSALYGLTIRNTTVAGNSTPIAGEASSPTAPSPRVQLFSRTRSSPATAPPPRLISAGRSNSAFSLIQSVSGATVNETVPASDVTGQPAQLADLANNGGSTQTMKPAVTSPAVDKGAAFGLGTDQRGQTRPFDFPTIPNSTAPGADGSDMGALELQPSICPRTPSRLGS